MNEELLQILEESIQLELNVAEIYKIFHMTFPDDANFWWKIYLEEKNHAALIRSIKELFLPVDQYPDEMFMSSLEKVRKANIELFNLIRNFRNNPPTREDAFNIALEVEESACEIHFQRFIDKRGKSKVEKVFEQLNSDDKDHALRLRSYMDAHGIAYQNQD